VWGIKVGEIEMNNLRMKDEKHAERLAACLTKQNLAPVYSKRSRICISSQFAIFPSPYMMQNLGVFTLTLKFHLS